MAAMNRLPSCASGQHQGRLAKVLGKGQQYQETLPRRENLDVGHCHTSRELQAQDLDYVLKTVEADSADKVHFGTNLNQLAAHEARIQHRLVDTSGPGASFGAYSNYATTDFNYASQIGAVGVAGCTSSYLNEDVYFRQSQAGISGQPPWQQQGPQLSRSTVNLTFACPFYCFDRAQFRSCLDMTLNRISDVRQHIKRRHTLPSFCPCCGCTFSDDPRYLKRDAHMRACKVNTGFSQLCGMTPDQLREMTAAGRRQQNDPERWYEIWGIMFPHRARPPSPYINTEHELRRIGAHAAVRQYLNEGRLQAFMEQRLWGFPLVEVTLRDLLQDLLDSYDMG